VSVAKDDRVLGARLVQAGAFFAAGGRITCLSCHRAHSGRIGTPQLVTTREALCLYCHPAQNTLAPESAALGAHPISVKPRRARVDASSSRPRTTGPGGELTCTTCHCPPRSSCNPGSGDARESYSCLLCHTRKPVASTPHARPAPQPRGGVGGRVSGGCHGAPAGGAVGGRRGPARSALRRLPRSGWRPPAAPRTTCWAGASRPGTELPLFWSDGRRYRQG
jgi:predicted CXXCH cytochrome family protein